MNPETTPTLEEEVRRLDAKYHKIRREYHETGEALKAARRRAKLSLSTGSLARGQHETA